MKRKYLIDRVNHLLDTYCQDCFLRDHLRQTYGRNYAQSFCIGQCSVGEQLKTYGEKLLTEE